MIVTLRLKKLLHPNQQIIYKNLKRFNVIVCGRRFGKTRLASIKVVTSAINKSNGLYWWVAPTFDETDYGWEEIRKLLLKVYGEELKTNNSPGNRMITLPNGSVIEFKGANRPELLVGAGLDGLVIDETADIKEDAWTVSLRPATIDKKAWVLFIGTPDGQNWFWRLYCNASKFEDWARFQFTSYDNPLIDKAEIDKSKAETPDLQFRQEYLAQFVSPTGTIFKREWFENRKLNDSPILFRVISWDTAFVNTGDYSCGIVADMSRDGHLYIREVFRKQMDFPELQNEVIRLAEKWNKGLKHIIIESKATGLPLIQTLELSSPEIYHLLTGFTPVGGKPDRAIQSSIWCENGTVILPPNDGKHPWLFEFEEELFSFPGSAYKDQVDAFTQLILATEYSLSTALKNRY